jgi:hypothetical protein
MKKSYLALLSAGILLLSSAITGCSNDFDDSQIQNRLTTLDNRITNLEALVSSQNQEISNIKTIITSLESKKYVQSYTSITNGYRLTFTDGTSIDITNGKDGTNGSSSSTPIIGVSKGTDGKYYWTVTVNGYTEFITDDNGNKIPVSGEKGDKGDVGAQGASGSNGITPLLKVDANGYWMVSYNNGVSYSYVVDTNGNYVSAIGEKGESGTSGVAYITSVYQHDSYIYVTFYNGSQVQLPIYNNFGISFSSKELQFNDNTSYATVTYTITGADSYTFVETIDKGNVKSKVSSSSASAGTITITKTNDLSDGASVIVLLCNRTQTITSVINIVTEVDSRFEDVVPDDIRLRIEQYMSIYRGVNPPTVNGAYALDPMTTVYCEDYGNGGYATGDGVTPMDIRFYGQDSKTNTINYEGYEGNTYEQGLGAFISGSGNYFTIYFNVNGVYSSSNISYTISYKTALVISGEKTSSGIRNMKYAFIMVSKSSDPDEELMKEGIFRIFEDSDYISENITWSHSKAAKHARQVLGDKVYNTVYSFCK